MAQLALTGNLREFGIQDVLGLLEWGKTGTLAVKRQQEEIALYSVKGAIADAEHFGVPQLTLGEILHRASFLTAQQLQEISILRLGNQRRIAAVLADMGFVPHKVIEDYLRLRITNAIRDLFLWQDGEFTFQPGAPSLGAGPSLAVGMKEAIVDGRQFRTEWGNLSHRINGLDYVVQLVDNNRGAIGSTQLPDGRYVLVAQPADKHRDASGSRRLSAIAQQALAVIDGQSSIRMIAQYLFVDDLEAAKAVDELAYAGLATIANSRPISALEASNRLATDDQAEDDLIRLLAKSQLVPASIKSNKPGDRIKALLRALQDCINDLLIYQDGQLKTATEAESNALVKDYLEQHFGDMLVELQTRYPALEALQAVNRRVDTSDLIDTYDLILGETRRTFYMEAVQGLSAFVKTVFDWVVGDEIDSPTIAAECQEAWQAFFQEIEVKVAELAMAEGSRKKGGG